MKKNNSVLLSTPYLLWMVAFTLIPLGVVGYYALTDPDTGVVPKMNAKFTRDNWDLFIMKRSAVEKEIFNDDVSRCTGIQHDRLRRQRR